MCGLQIKTAVYDDHVKLGGKLVEFAGYWLPLQYKEGVKAECEQTRSAATLFDVSHMGQVRIHGRDCVKFIESCVVGDIAALQPGQAALSLITNTKGGIIDDCVITKEAGTVGVVINGACKHKDLKHMGEMLHKSGMDAKIEHLEHLALFALQGPKAASALARIAEGVDFEHMLFMTAGKGRVAGIDVGVTRCGYTGEDGFELSVSNDKASALMQALLAETGGVVKPAGLGARDTLRVEAGLCLYGQDIDENTTPVEASLLWTIGKRRRAEGGFPGAKIILDQVKNKPPMKRVGFVVNGAPARSHTKLFASETASDDQAIGEILSGTFSPTLGKPVAMGYVEQKYGANDTTVYAKVRNKMVPVLVSKMPFVPSNYYRGPGSK